MRVMVSVRTDESLPPCFPAWTVELNNGDPAAVDDEAHENNPLVPFQPLVVCLRFLGVELDPAILNGSSKCHRYLSWSLGLFLLLSNCLCNIYNAILTRNQIAGDENATVFLLSSIDGDQHLPITKSTTMSWNLIMDYVNYGSLVIGVHTCLFILSRQPKWKSLLDNVQQILQEFPELNKTIRRLTIAGLFIIFSEISFYVGLSFSFMELNSGDGQLLHDLLFGCFGNLFLFYPLAGLLLFASIGWTVAMAFRSFGQELISKSNTRSNDDEASLNDGSHLMIAKWKQLHILLCDTVDGINDCLGPILLIWVSYIFVGFIAALFYLADEVHFNSALLLYPSWAMLIISTVQVAQHLLHFLIITGVPNYIRREAINMGKLVKKVNLCDSHLQEQVNVLTTQVSLSLPRITAMEFGDLNLSLIPKLIGTSLTYLIILCQFRLLEKN
ncbi:hypothetical protein DAPPUDRAFT_346848 [Daphnia pulex]|uniref:Gustatory receptor n=1 Tax=Daphnia pulex TaxID=6669 RepID=E9H9V5_DAPPU|nr:hypothetical protein DAPPUDRAFT_346848 [Daphnia pulex]|eukprot:EFX71466.1 hypothetical protein DAPPUDRAFT_346848 [Daphnia pulex]